MAASIERISFEEIKFLASSVIKAGLRFYDSNATTWFGARENGKIIGIIGCEKKGRTALIRTIFIFEEYRGQGISNCLVQHAMEYCEQEGFRTIKAYCKPTSVNLFLKKGFVVFSRFNDITHVIKKIGTKKNEQIMDCQEFCRVINGKVTSGPLQFRVAAIVDRTRYIKKMDSVIFLYDHREKINWAKVTKFAPCSIVYPKGKVVTPYIPQCTYIEVEDMNTSYWRFVDYYRAQFDIPVIAVTGTCGKTTTKEMIKHILSGKYQVQATKSSNNSFYINLRYLTAITGKTDAAVFETPVGGKGLLEYHCKYFKPTIGMITNIGIDHLKQCGTIENYIQAKGEMIKGLNYKGTLLLNADDENIRHIPLESFKGKLVYFGIHQEAEYQAKEIKYVNGGMQFVLSVQRLNYLIFVPGYGEHQVYNALSALAAVHQMGIGIKEAADQLATFVNIKSHLEISTGINGSCIIDDTWSSNPTSMEAALAILPHIITSKTKMILVGSISLLGGNSAYYHQEIGKMIASSGMNVLFAYGEMADEIVKGAKENQMGGSIYSCQTAKEIEEKLVPLLDANSALLIKASMYDKSLALLINKLKGLS